MKRLVRTLALTAVAAHYAACSRPEPPPAREPVEGTGAATAPKGHEAPANRQVALLAGGCFWGMEELLRKQPGVIETEVGYTGGSVENPRYEDVSSGTSGHAESVKVVFDPTKTSYEQILLFFFKIHDPTTRNRQGNDVGTQYRSAIFVTNAEQKKIAERVAKRVDASGQWSSPVTTQIVDAGEFYPAEGYHQDYLQRKPNGYTCHFERDVTF